MKALGLVGFFKMPYPGIHHVDSLESHDALCEIKVGDSTRWVPCRPLGYASFRHRCKAAWMVFTGKADALIWEQQ